MPYVKARWGNNGRWRSCPPGGYVVGMKVKAESFQGIDLSTNLFTHHKVISSFHSILVSVPCSDECLYLSHFCKLHTFELRRGPDCCKNMKCLVMIFSGHCGNFGKVHRQLDSIRETRRQDGLTVGITPMMTLVTMPSDFYVLVVRS